jgi:hypothetical protein
MFRTDASPQVGQFFSPTPPEDDFDAYARRVGLPDSSRATSKADVSSRMYSPTYRAVGTSLLDTPFLWD